MLKIWLPLGGSLENKGISNLTTTNVSATVDTNGKIGSCYYFNGSARMYSGLFTPDSNNISFACWLKMPSGVTSNGYILGLSKGTSPTLMLYNYGTTQFRIYIDGSNRKSYTHGLTQNTWYHIALTYNGSTAKLYINGTLATSIDYSATTITTANLRLFIGCRSNNSNTSGAGTEYRANYFNDVRYYNHCLSAAEVKEISQGLILHYKLDKSLNPNLLKLSNAIQEGNSQTSHILYYYFDFAGNLPTGTYTFSFDIRSSNGTDSCYISYANGSSTINRIATLTNIPMAWTHYSYTFTSSATNCNNIFFTSYKAYGKPTNNNNTGYIEVSNVKLENGAIETPYCIADSEGAIHLIQDSSGYGYNGTITGNISIASNSGRYSNSTYIPSGNTDYITTPTLQLPGDAITINFWFKSSNKSPGSSYHIPFVGAASSNESYEMSIYSTGYLRGGLVIGGSRKVNNCTSTKLTDGNWHMCSMTYDGSTIKGYVDGVMEKSTSATGTLVTSSYFVLGHYGTNTSYYAKEAYISDVRLYVTALSANDILALYHTGAKVDNLQNLHTFEYIENQSSIKLTKQGRLKCNEVVESTTTKFKENKTIETNNLIEL